MSIEIHFIFWRYAISQALFFDVERLLDIGIDKSDYYYRFNIAFLGLNWVLAIEDRAPKVK